MDTYYVFYFELPIIFEFPDRNCDFKNEDYIRRTQLQFYLMCLLKSNLDVYNFITNVEF